MLNRNQVVSELSTVYDVSQVYLDWCEQYRKIGTYHNQKRYLESFINSIGRRLKIGALKTHHITKWLESFDCTSTSKNDAVSIAQRMFNWAIEQQYISVSAIAKIAKPKRMHVKSFTHRINGRRYKNTRTVHCQISWTSCG